MNRLLTQWLTTRTIDPEALKRELELLDARLDAYDSRISDLEHKLGLEPPPMDGSGPPPEPPHAEHC